MRRGGVPPMVVAGMASTAMLGSGVAVLLQAAGTVGMSTADVIMVGLQVITLPGLVGVYFEVKAERKERERALAAERKERENAATQARQEREEMAARSEAGREKLHVRINELMDSLAEAARGDGERYGRLAERVDGVKEDVEGINFKLDGLGSKVVNQAEKAWDGRSADFDRRLERAERMLFDPRSK